MRKMLIAVGLLIGCGNGGGTTTPDAGSIPACPASTTYLGDPVLCTDGICVADGSQNVCRSLCSNLGDACSPGEAWNTIATRDGHECYCTPRT